MFHTKRRLVFILGMSFAFTSVARAEAAHRSELHGAVSGIVAAGLRTEGLQDPLGLDVLRPRLSWILPARGESARGLVQTAYRVLVASDMAKLAVGQGDVWDSGKVASAQTMQVNYGGPELASYRIYFWKVAAWDGVGRQSAWSAPAKWTTGVLHADEWRALWIAAMSDGPKREQARENAGEVVEKPAQLPIFRKNFSVGKPVKQAIVCVSGLGQYELHVNSAQVTDDLLTPGWTNYRKTVLYNSFDVTRLLQQGGNALGVMLGNGMYNVEGTKGRYTKFIGSMGLPKFILQMRIEYMDGTSESIVSDGSWKSAISPITYSSIYGGEDYDARLEQRGWDGPGFADAEWKPALEVDGPGGMLHAEMLPPVKVDTTYTPRSIKEPRPGVLVYDLGQNFSGWPEIDVRGPRGTTVTLIAGELLDKDGMVTQHSMNASPDSENRFSYTLKSGGLESWHPRFSYSGFRYVEVTGGSRKSCKGKPVVVALRGKFLHAATAVNGTFTTSNLLFTRIHKLIDMAIESNMVSVLTDCPHREKLGWLEQTYLNGLSILFNYDASQLYAKIAWDMRDSQLESGLVPEIAPEYVQFVTDKGVNTDFRDSPEWGGASVLSPWIAYTHYGDRKLLEDQYPTMVKYSGYLRGKLQDGMLVFGLGDWYDIGPKAPGESQLTSKGMTATATYYAMLEVLTQTAKVLGKNADAERYSAEADTVRESINAHLFLADTGQYDLGSQTANAIPVAMGLVPAGRQSEVMEHLVGDIRTHENHTTAGDIGFHYVVRALTDGGRSDVLNDMLLRKDSPSYGVQLEKDATTLTEAWDTNPDHSQNHFMLGHAEEWFYRGLAGIDFDLSREAPRQIVIRPSLVKGTNDASASYDSVLGRIVSGWRRSGRQVTISVTIPANASATVYLPAGGAILESGKTLDVAKGIKSIAIEGGVTRCIVGSGEYRFSFKEISGWRSPIVTN